MALNRAYAQTNTTLPNLPVLAGALSGDPMVVGQIPGVMMGNADANNTGVMQKDGIFNLSVKGINAGGNAAINPGDIIYFTVGDTPKLSAKNTGVRFGYALDAVASGATATIRVQLGY